MNHSRTNSKNNKQIIYGTAKNIKVDMQGQHDPSAMSASPSQMNPFMQDGVMMPNNSSLKKMRQSYQTQGPNVLHEGGSYYIVSGPSVMSDPQFLLDSTDSHHNISRNGYKMNEAESSVNGNSF